MEVICWVIPLIFHCGLDLGVWGTQLQRHRADCISDDKCSLITHKYYMLFHSLHKGSPKATLKSLTVIEPSHILHKFSERTWKLSRPHHASHSLISSYWLHSAQAFPTPFKPLWHTFFQGVAHQLTFGGLLPVSLLSINTNPRQAMASLG